jgi:GNAT superfamily N-acetyltransferase
MTRTVAGVALRPFLDRDEPEVLDLLEASLGAGPAGSRTADFFRWKHLANPFGRSYLLLAEADHRIVGLRAFMRWAFVSPQGPLRAVRAVDTATHPDYQGRGIFSSLTRRALDDLRAEADLIFNTPNEQSLPGYLKMGWVVVGSVPVRVRVRHPIRFVRRARAWKQDVARPPIDRPDAATAGRAMSDPRLGSLLSAAGAPTGIATERTPEYLRWRYADAPSLGYRAAGVERAGELEAMAIFRVRPRGALVEATVAELIVRDGALRAGRRALTAVARSTSADHLTCSFPERSTARTAARRSWFVRSPQGMTLVANTLGHELRPDPASLSAWSLSVGDIEVF